MNAEPDLSLAATYFHISAAGSADPVYETPATDLLKPATMDDLLRRGRGLLNGLGLDIAVSFVGLAFFGVPATVHTYMWQYDRVLDLSLGNLTVQLEAHGDHAHLVLKIGEVRWRELPADGREAAIVGELDTLFRETVNPIVETAAATAGFKPDLIWNQFGARMISVADFLVRRAPDEAMKSKYEADLALLVRGLPPETFNRRKNPYDHRPRYVESPYKPGETIVVRSSCCMWYRRENGVKCFNCPILSDEQRAEMKTRIEAERKASGG
ncbi:(2Fe-2S)-binding protein [Paenibacillus flagellatus]|uniref:Ferric siderophore reductase C-terminal domain-containing protein n=1 Tax=Paenibacillus flagellatus TaxID=2211139 RepID=A0A2V5JYN8_9BACL|nr:(2Fe-2S)-binding protein [Paenibacillus flagellatus]PYI51851.1 hypothetical protein DLM86_23315 [Paenibacillus flagellatus]